MDLVPSHVASHSPSTFPTHSNNLPLSIYTTGSWVREALSTCLRTRKPNPRPQNLQINALNTAYSHLSLTDLLAHESYNWKSSCVVSYWQSSFARNCFLYNFILGIIVDVGPKGMYNGTNFLFRNSFWPDFYEDKTIMFRSTLYQTWRVDQKLEATVWKKELYDLFYVSALFQT